MSKPDLPARLVGPGPGVLGNARWVVTETGIKMVEDLTARGVTLTNIARALGMDTATLRLVRHRQPEVEEAYQRGKSREEEALVGNLRRAANDGNVVAAIFLLKARHAYKEGQPMEVNVSVNTGGVLVVPERVSVEDYLAQKRAEGDGEMIDVTPARYDDDHPTGTRITRRGD